ncbi:hypothetical protein J6S37_00260 [Candidatus Saccharibacteria bacterium]|nr:hypothetical protein [Candidatus Saccharibacteria bacterium]
MEKKFELTDETIVCERLEYTQSNIESGFYNEECCTINDDGYREAKPVTLYRIRALKDIEGVVRKGEVGGFVQFEENLSHEGNCWIDSNSKVMGKRSRICEDAQIKNSVIDDGFDGEEGCRICGSAEVCSSLIDGGGVDISGEASIRESSIDGGRIYGNAHIRDSRIFIVAGGVIYGNAQVIDSLICGEDISIHDNSKITNSRIEDAVSVRGNAVIDNSQVGYAKIGGNETIRNTYYVREED